MARRAASPMSKEPPTTPQLATGPRRILYLMLGSLFCAVATVGVVLPVLPTTPFLLLAAYFFARSSPRFYDWLLRNRRFGPLIHQWRTDRSLPPGVRLKAIALVLLLFSISLWIVRSWPWLQIVLVACCSGLVWFLARLPERELEAQVERIQEDEAT